jgi:hypothetical protein
MVYACVVMLTGCSLFKSTSPTAPTASDASITYQVIGSPLNGVLGTATITYSSPTGTQVVSGVVLAGGVPWTSPTAFSFGQFVNAQPAISVVVSGCVIVQVLSNAQIVASSDSPGANCGMPATRSTSFKQ